MRSFSIADREAESGTQILICCNATYVEWSDQAIVTAKRPSCDARQSEVQVNSR